MLRNFSNENTTYQTQSKRVNQRQIDLRRS